MRTKQTLDEKKEKLLYGCLFGFILFASSAIYISIFADKKEAGVFLPYIPVALVGYLLAGNLLVWLYTRRGKGSAGVWFKGSAAIYTIGIIASAVAIAGSVLPQVLRYMLLVNLVIIILCWLLDYCFLVKVAKELNRGKNCRSLVVDIQECPRSVDAFCREIEDYCRKNGRRLEFLKRGKVAEIRMDGERYSVEVDSFYSMFGPMYALKFRQMH